MKYTITFCFSLLSQLMLSQNFIEIPPATPLPDIQESAIAFEDVDGDKDLDVLITGLSQEGRITKLFLNNGQGNFTEKANTPFVPVSNGAIAFGDVDGDQDKDLLITGIDDPGSNLTARLYLNDGQGNFTELTETSVEGVAYGSVDFANIDTDDDLDLLITGFGPIGPIAKLYTNDGTGNYAEVVDSFFVEVDQSSIDFADVDGDDDQDVLISGWSEDGEATKLYLNDGEGSFTENINVPFEDIARGTILLQDVDQDEDVDLIIAGDGQGTITKLYINNGSGIFTERINTPFIQVTASSITAADVDGDEDIDVLISGRNKVTNLSTTDLYLNNGNGNFTKSNSEFQGILGGSIAFADVDGDEDQDILITGTSISNGYLTMFYLNDGQGNYEALLSLPFKDLSESSIVFVDIDDDQDQDVFLTGYDGFTSTSNLFINDGSGNFKGLEDPPFIGTSNGAVAFVDVDQDEDLDVFISGYEASQKIRMTKLYIQNENGDFEESFNNNFVGLSGGSIAVADMDGDEDIDLLITGETDSNQPFTKLYSNDGMGNFSAIENAPFPQMFEGSVVFEDIDQDMDQDVLIAGADDSYAPLSRLYLNDGTGNFNQDESATFEPTYRGTIHFADIDNDQDKDVLITGLNSSFDLTTKLYLNDGNGSFTENLDHPFEGVISNSAVFADVDGDEDLDLLLAGQSNLDGLINRLYINNGSGQFTELFNTPFKGIINGSVAFADIDKDMDMDVLISGSDLFGPSTRLYINQGTITSVQRDFGTPNKLPLLYPNPGNQEVTLEYDAQSNSSLTVNLLDAKGTSINQYSWKKMPMDGKIHLNTQGLTKGLYFVKVNVDNTVHLLKLIIL